VAFAQNGPGTRTTQLFFNLRDNQDLDKTFVPIGKVISGMDAVSRFYSAYGDWPPRGHGPDPLQLQSQGNAYLQAHFPRLDYIKKVTIQ
jgi:peptidyl-prolyl cis-trans isomerase A (cyclophilin A)